MTLDASNAWDLEVLCRAASIFGRKKAELVAAKADPVALVSWLIKAYAEGVERPGLIATWRLLNLDPAGAGDEYLALAELGPQGLAEVIYWAPRWSNYGEYLLVTAEITDDLAEKLRLFARCSGDRLRPEHLGLKSTVLAYAHQREFSAGTGAE